MSAPLANIAAAKAAARDLRARLAAEGREIGHGQALELIARQHGFRDWNACHAALVVADTPAWQPGGRVRGRYLSQPFEATVISAAPQGAGWYRLALDLDAAVDVVRFDSFSSFRKRVQGTVGPAGTSRERTSDGHPQLVIEL
ncbi:glyoxalase superfamily protein [Antarcticimicrobium sediminis]|uniref:Glyoxalase-related protein domain-containing protein n=1 Tax=Antarcticimicrobium sediminis TaxID=2546227 RepID=A0A4R5ELQ1_9RHOB|nr:glyoxalase superfamily protein [Antarcticimicrobium sediminis]TDE35599.1 hypothetical protein E1B25_16725 [Antarcticimicrobium sediminis]